MAEVIVGEAVKAAAPHAGYYLYLLIEAAATSAAAIGTGGWCLIGGVVFAGALTYFASSTGVRQEIEAREAQSRAQARARALAQAQEEEDETRDRARTRTQARPKVVTMELRDDKDGFDNERYVELHKAWSDLSPYREKTRRGVTYKLYKSGRTEDTKNEFYYQRDFTHEDTEVYKKAGSKGIHMGSVARNGGPIIKPPVPGRTIDL